MASSWVRYSVAVYAGLLLAGAVVAHQPPPARAAWTKPRPQASLLVPREWRYAKTGPTAQTSPAQTSPASSADSGNLVGDASCPASNPSTSCAAPSKPAAVVAVDTKP